MPEALGADEKIKCCGGLRVTQMHELRLDAVAPRALQNLHVDEAPDKRRPERIAAERIGRVKPDEMRGRARSRS